MDGRYVVELHVCHTLHLMLVQKQSRQTVVACTYPHIAVAVQAHSLGIGT